MKIVETTGGRPLSPDHALQQVITEAVHGMSRGQRADLHGRVTEAAVAKGLTLEGNPIPLITTPTLFDRGTMVANAGQIGQVYGALTRVEALTRSDTPLGNRIFGAVTSAMSEGEKALAEASRRHLPPGPTRLNGRFDTFPDRTQGKVHVIEFNGTNPEGLLYEKILRETGPMVMTGLGLATPEQLGPTAFDQAVQMFQDAHGDRTPDKPLRRIGIVYEPQGEISMVNKAELPRLRDDFAQRGIEIVIGGPRDVEAKNGTIAVKGHPVDLMWRNAVDLDAAMNDPQSAGFVEAMSRPDKYNVVNHDNGRIVGSKQLLAALHNGEVQEAIKMTPAEQTAVRETVPHTFDPSTTKEVVGPDGVTRSVKDHLTVHREDTVIKDSSGTHAEGLFFGANPDDESFRWTDVVDQAMAGGYVAQKFIPDSTSLSTIATITPSGDVDTREYMGDLNPHAINGTVPGTAICRASPYVPDQPKKALNVAAGGGLQPMIVADVKTLRKIK